MEDLMHAESADQGRTYAIGDIHGHLHKLERLFDRCIHDCGNGPATFVFLGDYIDRGPDSHGVVEFLINLQRKNLGRVICLKGNHEAVAIECASGADPKTWYENGGLEMLRSYGVAAPAELPFEHLAWFKSLPLFFDDGKRYFAHAGINPMRLLDQQVVDDLIWIREPFLSCVSDYGRLIVHGHTPLWSRRPDLRSNRLNIDTGAGYGGPLTAAAFNNMDRMPAALFQEVS